MNTEKVATQPWVKAQTEYRTWIWNKEEKNVQAKNKIYWRMQNGELEFLVSLTPKTGPGFNYQNFYARELGAKSSPLLIYWINPDTGLQEWVFSGTIWHYYGQSSSNHHYVILRTDKKNIVWLHNSSPIPDKAEVQISCPIIFGH